MPQTSTATTPDNDTTTAPTTGSTTAGAPAATGTGTTADTSTPPAPASDPATEQQLAAAAQRADEATAERDRLQAALDAVNKALNPDADSTEQDPATLAAAVAERDQQINDLSGQLRTARVELAAYKAAAELGAHAERLLDSRTVLDTLNQLDPDAEQFDEQLAAALKAAVDADPDRYRAAPPAPGRAGAEFRGAPTTDKQPATLREAIAARLSS